MPLTFPLKHKQMLQAMGLLLWDTRKLKAPLAVQPQPTPQAERPSQGSLVPGQISLGKTNLATAKAVPPQQNSAAEATIAFAPSPLSLEDLDWPALKSAVASCTACRLCQTRKQPLFGTGPNQADVLVLTDPPSAKEDELGEVFAGASGQLFEQLLLALSRHRPSGPRSVKRDRVFLSPIIKCYSGPQPVASEAELSICSAYWQRQIELLQPKVILALGRTAVRALTQSDQALGQMRGQIYRYQAIPVVVSYHPDYLLRNPLEKGKAWEDLCLLETLLQPCANL